MIPVVMVGFPFISTHSTYIERGVQMDGMSTVTAEEKIKDQYSHALLAKPFN